MPKRIKYTSYKKNVEKALDKSEVRALNAIGVFGNGLIVASTPVGRYDDGRVGGNLRDSNSWEVDEKEKRIDFQNNAHYAPYVHEGTSRNRRKQPFMRNPIESNLMKIAKLAAEQMRLDK